MKKILSIFAAVLFASSMFAAEVTVTKTVHDLFPDDENGTKELTLFNEDGLSISVNDKGNNGKIYDTGKEWRIYRSSDAVVTVALTSGVIKSIAFTFKYANAGTLLHGTNVMTSGTAIAINAASATFTVGNSDENTNGQIKITGFTIVYDKDVEPGPEVCTITAEGGIPFNSCIVSTGHFEEDGILSLAVATDPAWFETDEPSTDGTGFSIAFKPKQKSLKDLRGIYTYGSSNVLSVLLLDVDGGPLQVLTPKSATFEIMLNEEGDAYNVAFVVTVEGESEDVTTTGIIYGVCSDDIDIDPYCHVGSTADFGWKAVGLSDDTTGDITLGIFSNPDWMVEAGLGDGELMGLTINAPENRKDLRGAQTLKSGLFLVRSDGTPGMYVIDEESAELTFTLDENKETYDLTYKLTLIVSETESHVTEGTVYRICDSKMDIPAGIEETSAAKVNGNKIIRNGHLFIEHEGRIYNANGVQVK